LIIFSDFVNELSLDRRGFLYFYRSSYLNYFYSFDKLVIIFTLKSDFLIGILYYLVLVASLTQISTILTIY